MSVVHCDLETFSRRSISNGSYAYSEDCEVLLWSYAVDDAPARVWDLTDGSAMPAELNAALADRHTTWVWHNGANFDLVVLRSALGISLPIESLDDTMVMAFSHGLPGSLGDLCQVYEMPEDKAKDKDGRRLVAKFCKPAPRTGARRTRLTDPEDWDRFVNYARLDVEAMRELWRKLPRWNWRDYDRDLFAVDRRINERGMLIDTDLARACVALAESVRQRNGELTRELTDGAVAAASQRDALLEHILGVYGVKLPDLTKATLERRLDDPDLPAPVKELLAVRLSTAKASVAKYAKLLDCVSHDGRLRGSLQFRGAARTGRYAGRLFQPQNLPRPTLPQPIIDMGVEAIKGGWADLVADEGELMSSCLRSVIIAPPGQQLVVADLSNIEGRMLAWLAGEEWKLEAFRRADAGTGEDLYKLTYGRTFGVDPKTVDKKQRQIGKVEELALGYQGGVGAFLTFASAYGVDLDALATHVRGAIDPSIWRDSEASWEWFKEKKLTRGLKRETFIALESIKRGWRATHPAICGFWKQLETASRRALAGETVRVNHVVFDRKGSWLRIRLPSGRYLCYPGAQAEDGGQGIGCLSYMGVNQYTRKWERIHTSGGKLAENLTQAAAYDVLAEAMPRIEAAGFRIVLSVHDEFICEAGPDRTAEELSALMATPPRWAPDLPLAAKGFTSLRYRKD